MEYSPILVQETQTKSSLQQGEHTMCGLLQHLTQTTRQVKCHWMIEVEEQVERGCHGNSLCEGRQDGCGCRTRIQPSRWSSGRHCSLHTLERRDKIGSHAPETTPIMSTQFQLAKFRVNLYFHCTTRLRARASNTPDIETTEGPSRLGLTWYSTWTLCSNIVQEIVRGVPSWREH